MLLKSIAKPVAALVMAAFLATSMTGVAEARNRHNGANLLLGLGIGLLVGSAIVHNNRHRGTVYYSNSSFDDDEDQNSCYRSNRVVCNIKRICKFDDWGDRHCRSREQCYHPVICN